ncbi:MAG: hypothetical protein JWN67_2553 [Actinomycetia bacterium]|nr:hypothetical protein [Actinomycetes bacterium]
MKIRPKARRLGRCLSGSLLAASMLVIVQSSPAFAASCTTSIDNPHFSSGAGGIIVKGHFDCGAATVDEVAFVMQLYVCPSYPSNPTEANLAVYCTLKANNGRSDYNVPPGDHTRYAPENTLPGVHGTGYWVGCIIINWYDPNFQGSSMSTSNPVYLSA